MTKRTIFDYAREATQVEEKLLEFLYTESRDDVEDEALKCEVIDDAVTPEPVDC